MLYIKETLVRFIVCFQIWNLFWLIQGVITDPISLPEALERLQLRLHLIINFEDISVQKQNQSLS